MRSLTFIALISCFTTAAFAATYKGKNIDGKKYAAVVSTSDGGLVSADVVFEGRVAHLYFEKWTHKVYLTKLEIDDPRRIEGRDGSHGWTIEICEKLD